MLKKKTIFITFFLSLLSFGYAWVPKFFIVSSPIIFFSSAKAEPGKNLKLSRIAESFTVRIEGSTLGSGVLIKKESNQYTVLTAWHVVKGNLPTEEVGIITPDGIEHIWDLNSVKQIGNVDMAVLTFTSNNNYLTANIGNLQNFAMGNKTFVAGFALPSASIPIRIIRFTEGSLIANTNAQMPDGYQLIYSNITTPGMSGGAVLNSEGELIGIHGRAEGTTLQGTVRKTGTNQAVPITFYQSSINEKFTSNSNENDYLLFSYYSKGNELSEKGQWRGAIAAYTKVLDINPNYADAYFNRAIAKVEEGLFKSAISDYDKAIELNPLDDDALYNRGIEKKYLGDYEGAISDFDKAIEINPLEDVFYDRGLLRFKVGNFEGGCADWQKVRSFGNSEYTKYIQNNLKKFNKKYKPKFCFV